MFGHTLYTSSQNPFHDIPVNVGQATLETIVVVGEALVVDSHLMEDGYLPLRHFANLIRVRVKVSVSVNCKTNICLLHHGATELV